MDLQEVLCLHEAYTKGRPDGKRAIFRGADLRDADLSGVKPNWDSHALLSALLLSAAAKDANKRKVAGLILVSPDWCWREFLSIDDPLTHWALKTLRMYETSDNPMPKEVG